MGRPKKAATDGSDSLAKSKQSKRGQAPKQVQEAIERHRADEAVAAKEEKIQVPRCSSTGCVNMGLGRTSTTELFFQQTLGNSN